MEDEEIIFSPNEYFLNQQNGKKEGRREGRLEMLFDLVYNNLLPITEAAMQAGFTEENFKKEMHTYRNQL